MSDMHAPDALTDLIDRGPFPPGRCRRRNDRPVGRGPAVVYWMQRSQRAVDNDALNAAVHLANALGLPTVVVFVKVRARWSGPRHERVLWDGIVDAARTLAARGVGFAAADGDPVTVVAAISAGAAAIVVDAADMPTPRRWRDDLAARCRCALLEVDADLVIPGSVVTDRKEWAARTLRPRVHRLIDAYAPIGDDPVPRHPAPDTLVERVRRLAGSEVLDPLREASRVRTPADGIGVTGGHTDARRRLTAFLDDGLGGYAERRPDPLGPSTSGLSVALHYGHICVRRVLDEVRRRPGADAAAFVEQLVVRRELAVNHCRFDTNPTSYTTVPQWARATLDAHRHDPRPTAYTRDEFEAGATHDRAWNAAMTTIRETGLLHNHMRMYWGKQVLAWSDDPETAFATLLSLNNRYFLDGRDAVSAANVAWCFGLHDRPFAQRPIFGTVRPMTRAGLDRKFRVARWIDAVERRWGPVDESPLPGLD